MRKRLVRRIFDGFNLKKEAEELGVSVWQTPSFLFIVMGLIIVMAMTGVYIIAQNYNSPELLIGSESLVVAVLFILGNSIIQSIEEIARANKIKTEFVSIASHQLKTPLSEISWEVELFVSKFSAGLDEKQLAIIKEIGKSNRKMIRLVSDLLDVARIDQGRLALDVQPMDLGAVAQDVIASSKIIADANNVTLAITMDKDIPAVIGDKRKTWIVIDNLVSNAIKYIEKKGSVEVSIRKDDTNVEVRIADTGVGIPKSQQDMIFQKFFRIDNATKNQTEGTGLGLYIAKNIIEQSKGSIWFTSKEHEGSTFFFTLPIAENIAE